MENRSKVTSVIRTVFFMSAKETDVPIRESVRICKKYKVLKNNNSPILV
jgi:hypothetical protein